MSKREVIKKRGGPYSAQPININEQAWFYTNGSSITVVVRNPGIATLQAKIPLRTLKKIVAAME